jgi:LCP family protein required for cell wall assembly
MNRNHAIARDQGFDRSSATREARRGHPIAFLVTLIVLAAGAVYGALAMVVRVDALLAPGISVSLPWRFAQLPGLDAAMADDGMGSDRINILVLGVDRRPHHDVTLDGPPRTDSIYIVSLDPLQKTATAVALPRDLYVEVPNPRGGSGNWDTRINTAYHYGALYKYPGGGAALARETVEHNFKLKIHQYVVIDWVAFADVVDALGGVEVTVPETLRGVEAYNVRDGNSFPITIDAGRQTFDSITALAYARYRDGDDGDFGRIARQQQVMMAVAEKALALGWLGRAPSLYTRFRGAFETDISPLRLTGLAALVRQIGLDHVTMVSLAGTDGANVTRRITPEGEDVLVALWERLGPALASAIPDRRLQEEQAVIKLVNAAGQAGLARRSAAVLTRYGLPPGYVLAYDNERIDRHTTTSLVVYGDKEYTARRVAELLDVPRAPILRQDASLREAGGPDIVVMLGSDVTPIDGSRYLTFATPH